MKSYNILGFNLSPFASINTCIDFIAENPGLYISLSAESIMSKSKKFKEIANSPFSYFYADGVGAVISAYVIHNIRIKKLPGCELWLALIKKYNTQPIAIIGATPEVINLTNTKLKEKYNANIVYKSDGYFQDEEKLYSDLKKSQPRFIFIAMGQPQQEIIGEKVLALLPKASIMGVGGSFDVLSGTVKRAPNFFIKYHLEWFYRLLKTPNRLPRQIVLPKLVLKLFILKCKSIINRFKTNP